MTAPAPTSLARPTERARRAAAVSRPLRLAAAAVAVAAALYALLLVALWFGQERLLFHPVTLDPARPLAAVAGQADVHERWVDVPGARLSVLELRLPDPKGVVFFLHGNGGNLAARVQPDLTLLVSPYRSMVALAGQHYPWVPSAVLRYPLRTDAQLARIHTPVLLLHGDHDALIPIDHSRALQAIAPQTRLIVVPGAAHGDMQDFDAYLQAVRAALRAL